MTRLGKIRRSAGLTLVELAIVLLILALLALAAAPFTRAWVDGNRQLQMRSRLMEGVGQARALALRNPRGFADGGAAETVRLSYDATTHALRLEQKNANGSWPDPDAPPYWQSPGLAGEFALKLAGAGDFADVAAFDSAGDAFACVAFDTRGRPVAGSSACPLPAGKRRIAIGIRNQEPVYVELL